MTNENFKDVYIDRDDYLFMDKINDKNILLFKIILFSLLISFLFITYKVVDKVFLVQKNKREPKLLFVVYVLIFTLLYFVYHEFAVGLTNIIINNSYPI
jgi:hypothetical protein|tara:strand:+ start:5669 stop:5965 length:297 start_codon:yes stop_codon:yes gene_type:complete